MKKEELKKVLKPIIKQCIKEVIFEEGALSTIISEVVKGTSAPTFMVSENKSSAPPPPNINSERVEQKRKQLLEQKKRMLDAIGRNAYNGVDLFEGTTPTTSPQGGMAPQGSKPLDGVSPSDPGVDISSFASSGIWKKLAGN